MLILQVNGVNVRYVEKAEDLKNPNIIIADEPTGNLDKSKENEIFLYLKGMANNGKCVIVVSHSDDVKKYADKIYTLEDGKLIGDDAKK